MDQTHSIPHHQAPRLSRLPLPRVASKATSVQSDGTSGVKSTSRLPRLSAVDSSRSKTSASQTDGADQQTRSRYGWANQQNRSYSPAAALGRHDQTYLSEATTPTTHDVNYVEGDENENADTPNAAKLKRRPRPSLSERALETMSLVPPSPSPSRRGLSTADNDNFMSPPSRPSLRISQSNASLRGRPQSPFKQLQKISNGKQSPTKEASFAPVAISNGNRTATPVKTHVPGSKMNAVKPSAESLRTKFSVDGTSDRPKLQPASFAAKAKTVHGSNLAGIPRSSVRPSLDAIFKDPPPRASASSTTTNVSSSAPKPNNRTVRYEPSTKVPASLSSNKPSASHNLHRSGINTVPSLSSSSASSEAPPKTSLTLRETIARAKAAKKGPLDESQTSALTHRKDDIITEHEAAREDTLVANGPRVLENRIRTAITTGSLNIAAMQLTELPQELLKMYDFNQNSHISWAETVDLVKFVAADNELEELHEDFFPDWSIEELQSDEGKTNQFAGLQTLNLRGNILKYLPVGLRRLRQLHSLTLNNNNLTMRAFDVICQLPSLKELILANNDLRGSVPTNIDRLENVQVLDLHANRLSSLPGSFNRLSRLQRLNLSDNAFEDLPFEAILALPLVELNLSKNKLRSTPFSGPYTNTTLEELNVASNMLQSLGNQNLGLRKLQTLVCDNNQLTELPNLTSLTSLTSLSASENQLEALPEGFVALSNLRSANLGANQIRVLDPLISKMSNLTTLNLGANPLRDRKYLTMDTSDLKADLAKRIIATLDDVPQHLTYADSETHPDTFFDSSEYVYKPEKGVLDLSSQGISVVDISKIDLSKPIHTIRISNNELTTFPGDLLVHPNISPCLRTLDLSHNLALSTTAYLTEQVSLPVLETLYIVSTGLATLEPLMTHLTAPLLRELNISCHRLTGTIPSLRSAFPRLTTLLAIDNCFTTVDAENVRGLEVLDIRNNDIEHLPPKLGELGNVEGNRAAEGRLRAIECSGNKFRVPRQAVLDKGTEAILKDLRRMVPADQVADEWQDGG